jgi:tRNA threonylcarbamoyladenosine biosynthesis protein TsaE
LCRHFIKYNFSTKSKDVPLFLITNFHSLNRFIVNYYFRAVEMGTWPVPSLNDLDEAAIALLKSFPEKRVFAFFGEMGAGKTTFIKSLCKALEVTENVSSPTFALVNEYLSGNGESIYHFDFYRIQNEKEAVDIGISEYFNSGNYCFVEWSEKILHLLPEDAVKVRIGVKNETRIITTENG